MKAVYLVLILVSIKSESVGALDPLKRDCCEENRNVTLTKQGHGRAGPEELSKVDCKCKGDESKTQNGLVFVLSAIGISLMTMATIAILLQKRKLRQLRIQRQEMRQYTTPISTRNVSLQQEREAQVRLAKESLVDKNLSEGVTTQCVCCLEYLKENAVSPPNCNHVFHRECILQWLDTALTSSSRSGNRDTNKEVRALQCPTCAASMLPLALIEMSSPSTSSDYHHPAEHQEDSQYNYNSAPNTSSSAIPAGAHDTLILSGS